MPHRIALTLLLVFAVAPLEAFDDDFGISEVELKEESFLDINAHGFRKSLDLEWREQLNGWRMGGGSTSTDRAFIRTDLRLYHELSEALMVSLDWDQDEFYAPKPTPAPIAAVHVYPFDQTDIGLAIQGEPDLDKRQSDFGYALIFGRQPHNFVKVTLVEIDKFWNSKNSLDNSFYRRPGELISIEGSYDLNERWQIDFELEQDQPLDFVFTDQISSFQYEAEDYQTRLIFRQTEELIYGLNLRSLRVNKNLTQTQSDQSQQIEYRSFDLYRISQFDPENELTLGARFDDIEDQVADAIDPAASYRFDLNTRQVYATWYHSYSTHQAWDLGLYIGYSDRRKTFAVANSVQFDQSSVQGKLRTSWQYQSADKSAVLVISISLNLDDLADDPGDGGGLYFQKRF